MNYWMRVQALFKRKQLNRDLEDELAFHLAMREAKNRTRGIDGQEARYAARRQVGNGTRIKEASPEARGLAGPPQGAPAPRNSPAPRQAPWCGGRFPNSPPPRRALPCPSSPRARALLL